MPRLISKQVTLEGAGAGEGAGRGWMADDGLHVDSMGWIRKGSQHGNSEAWDLVQVQGRFALEM